MIKHWMTFDEMYNEAMNRDLDDELRMFAEKVSKYINELETELEDCESELRIETGVP